MWGLEIRKISGAGMCLRAEYKKVDAYKDKYLFQQIYIF